MKFWSMDTEDNSKGKTELINFFNGETHTTFKKDLDAIDFLKQFPTEEKTIIWATNLQYDIANVFKDFYNQLDMVFAGSRIISVRLKGTEFEFWDTLNHWKMSVAEMGKRIGLHKLEENLFDSNKKPTLEELTTRCHRDTEITFKFAEKMVSHYESIGCKIKATIGATALNLFQQKYFKYNRKRIFTQKHLDFMRTGYYGGRTEIFFNEPIEGNIQYYDFNSLYPAMLLRQLPVLNRFHFTKKPNLFNEGVLECKVRCPETIDIPYLPTKDKKTGSLIFPTGIFRGVWTYFEIREAKKYGYEILETFQALEFVSGTSRPCEEFVLDLYEKRLEAKRNGDELLGETYKLLMNNLYGKFFQGNEKTKIVPLTKKLKINPGDTVFNNIVLKKEVGDYPLHTNGIWAMYCTAYGRHEIHKKAVESVQKGALLIYMDTDSLILEHKKILFKDSKELGELKLEMLLKYAHFKLPKQYKIIKQDNEAIYKTKGVPKKFSKEFFEEGRASFMRPYKIKETLRRNLSPKRKHKLLVNFWDTVEKISSKVYDKRIVLKGGFTRPLKLTE